MIEDVTNPRSIVEKNADDYLLCEMIDVAAEKLMSTEDRVKYGKMNDLRLARRNGNRYRNCETRAGTVELRVPTIRTNSYCQAFSNPAAWPRRL